MANVQNLKSWKPGQSGNPAGKPKGTRHLSTWIQELMEDETLTAEFLRSPNVTGPPIQAIVISLVGKSLQGDMKAFELLAKYGYGNKLDITSQNENYPYLF